MANRLEDIVRRKQALIDKAAHERTEIARNYANLKSPFDMSSTVLGLGRALKTHPIVAAGLSSFLVSGYAGKVTPIRQRSAATLEARPAHLELVA